MLCLLKLIEFGSIQFGNIGHLAIAIFERLEVFDEVHDFGGRIGRHLEPFEVDEIGHLRALDFVQLDFSLLYHNLLEISSEFPHLIRQENHLYVVVRIADCLLELRQRIVHVGFPLEYIRVDERVLVHVGFEEGLFDDRTPVRQEARHPIGDILVWESHLAQDAHVLINVLDLAQDLVGNLHVLLNTLVRGASVEFGMAFQHCSLFVLSLSIILLGLHDAADSAPTFASILF